MRPHRVLKISKSASEKTPKLTFRRIKPTEPAPVNVPKPKPEPTPKLTHRPLGPRTQLSEKVPKLDSGFTPNTDHRPQEIARSVPEKASGPIPSLIHIENATFYKDYPSRNQVSSSDPNPPLFPSLKFQLPATPEKNIGRPARGRYYAVVGTNTTPFLTILQGGYICEPSGARTYPYLSSDHIPEELSYLRIPSRAIKYVGFSSKALNDAPGGVRGAYLSARYESRREETDWSLGQYLRGETELNPSQKHGGPVIDAPLYDSILDKLRLRELIKLPVSHLSNGQTRRARIAKALLDRPRLLLLDDPFMGLDPPTLVGLSPVLRDFAEHSSPKILLGLRPQDPIPEWITHVVYIGANNQLVVDAEKEQALFTLYSWMRASAGGPDVTSAERKMAIQATEEFGPPPKDLPPILTQYGIRTLDAYSKAWDISRKYRDTSTGLVDTTADLPGFQRRTIMKWMRRIKEEKRSARIQMVLTTTLDNETLGVCRQVLDDLKTPPPDLAQPTRTTEDEDVSTSSEVMKTDRETLIELNSIVVKYGEKVVLGHEPPQPGFTDPGLNLKISRGTRILLLGPNGSGKTTLLSLLTSDHPQSYSLPIKFFGRTRLPSPGTPGLSLWEIQSRIGHSSPEVHAFFPKGMTVRRVLESAWAETFSSKPNLTPERTAMVDHFLHVWTPELCHDPRADKFNTGVDADLSWATDKIRHPSFGQLPMGTQRLLLLLRAIIKQPDIVILDEGFSGIPETTRIKALNWLEHGDGDASLSSPTQQPESSGTSTRFPGLTDQQAIIVVSHVREEIPACINEFIRLPSEEEASVNKRTVQIEKTSPGYVTTSEGWNRAWGL